MAQKAGKAGPALAVAGALAAAPQAHRAAPARPAATARPVFHLDAAHVAGRTYTVRPGDTLSGIARRFYGQAGAWPRLYQVNRAEIGGPGLIHAGQVLRVPRDPPAHSAYRAPAGGRVYRPRHSAGPAPFSRPPAVAARGGIYSYAALEQLWTAEGGNRAVKGFAACIAEHESGGNPGAISPTADYGLWQEHGDPAALNPAVSAQTAVQMSADGTNWSPWTTEPDC